MDPLSGDPTGQCPFFGVPGAAVRVPSVLLDPFDIVGGPLLPVAFDVERDAVQPPGEGRIERLNSFFGERAAPLEAVIW